MENNFQFNRIREAINFISANYQKQPDLEEIANHVHLSKFHFQRLFQEWAGVSPKQFLQCVTTEHAKKSLLAGRSTLAAAHESGLSGNGRLHDLFVKIEACTPGEFQRRGKNLLIKHAVISTPFGAAWIAETDKGICQLFFLEEDHAPENLMAEFPEAKWADGLGKYGKMVEQYFANWQIPYQQIVLDLKGTPFQIKVWQALLAIPPSQSLAYNDIAEIIGNPKASRAAGTAIGKNPVAYLIPCHRVIRQSGEMGGYRWGVTRKIAINAFENLVIS